MHRLCEFTLISFKCQSIRSEVQCTNKTLHNEPLKNMTVHVDLHVTCMKNLILPKVYSGREKLSMSGFIQRIFTIDCKMLICQRLISLITAAVRRGRTA